MIVFRRFRKNRILFISFLNLLVAASTEAKDWRIGPSSSPLGAYVYRDSKNKQKAVGWIGSPLAQAILGKELTASNLNDLNDKDKEILGYLNRGILRLASSEKAAFRLNEAIQAEWVAAKKEKCAYIDPKTRKRIAPVITVAGWLDPYDDDAHKTYYDQGCSDLTKVYYAARGPSQLCTGTISCGDASSTRFCVCEPKVKASFDVEKTGDPKSLGLCPPADDCWAQCKANILPTFGKILTDTHPGTPGDATFEKYAGDKTVIKSREAPLVVRSGKTAGLCAYRHVATPYDPDGQIVCITTTDHCPTPAACTGQGCAGWVFGHYK